MGKQKSNGLLLQLGTFHRDCTCSKVVPQLLDDLCLMGTIGSAPLSEGGWLVG